MQLVDTHSHIYLEHFQSDLDDVIAAANNAGVTKILLPNIDRTTTEAMLGLVQRYPGTCYPMMGLHPGSVKADNTSEIDHVENELATGRYIAVGEIGIDLYWDKTYCEQQKEVFAYQIELAKKHGLPIVIHARDSFDEIFEIVDRLHDDRLKGIFHCFTGNASQAAHIMAYGSFMMGIGGVLTFKNSGLDIVVKDIPMDYLVLETDAPYLTPAPHRGKRNEPAYVRLVAEKLAGIKNLSFDEVAKTTTSNAKIIFEKPF